MLQRVIYEQQRKKALDFHSIASVDQAVQQVLTAVGCIHLLCRHSSHVLLQAPTVLALAPWYAWSCTDLGHT